MTVALGQREWIEHPIRAPRFHDIQVPNEQDRSALPTSTDANDEILVLGVDACIRPDDLHVGTRESGRAEPSSEKLGRFRGASRGERGVRLDELAQDIAAERLICGRSRLCVR